MLKEEKIHLMTRLSFYEKHEGKRTIPIGKYYKKDYIAVKMLQTALTTAVAYFCILALWAFAQFEVLMEDLSGLDITATGIRFVLGFVVMEAFFLTVAYFGYRRKYNEARKSLKLYYQDLKHLKNYY